MRLYTVMPSPTGSALNRNTPTQPSGNALVSRCIAAPSAAHASTAARVASGT